jgi:hypothetical protein
LSITIGAVRARVEGGPAAHWVWLSLTWSAALFTTFFTVALALYRRSAS